MRRHSQRIAFTLLLATLTPWVGAQQEDFLLYAPSVEVVQFEATAREDGRVWVQWRTTFESGVNAFRVVRWRRNGTPQPVGPGYVRSRDDESGGAYELADDLANIGAAVHYDLLMVSSRGPDQPVATWTGVIRPRRFPVANERNAQKTSASSAGVSSLSGKAGTASFSTALWIGSGDRVRPWTDDAPADRVRLSLRDEGVYRVSAQELADAGGWNVTAVTNAIANTNLNMSCRGVPVGWYADGASLLFHGLPPESRFAPENVYWVALGQGSNMTHRTMTPGAPATTNVSFVNLIAHQGTDYLARVTYSSLADAPASYVAFSPLITAGGNLQVNETLTDRADGVWTGLVTVHLLSYYEVGDVGTDDHAARVSVGGTPVGEPAWSGEQYLSFTYPFSSTNLTGAVAALKIENIGVLPVGWVGTDYTRFLCVSFDFSYPRLYRARNGALRCRGGESNTVAVSGFASDDVLVFDVTMTNAPVVMEPVTMAYDGVAGSWTASFPCEGTGHVYWVCSKSAGIGQPAVRGVRDVDWSSSANAADYVILVPPEAWRGDFRQAMQPLADFRNAQGLRTKIVDVEATYNAFSYGLVDPLAIRAFCAAVYPHGLKYLLLAGAGALDFKHQRLSVNDYTACLIPTMIAGQTFYGGDGMTVALDASLGDVAGNIAPEVAVGRLPTTKTQELAVVVQKTIAYEGALLWKQQASVAADWDNTGIKYYQFSAGTDRLLAPLENAGRTWVKHYVTASDSGAVVRVHSLFPALKAGSGLFHFFGHTGEQSLGGGSARLLYNTDISSINWEKPTITVVMGCRVNRWQSLTTTVCIVPYGLFATNTGFVAGLGATGYMLGREGEDLAVNLYTDAAEQGTLRLGDVFRRGLQSMAGTVPAERLLCYSLVGDPALVFRHDVSAMGTPVPYLAQHGQTAPNADLADPDLDGWPTWREYLAGANPTSYVFRITAERLRPEVGRLALDIEAASNLSCRVLYNGNLLATEDWTAAPWAWTNATVWTPPETTISPQGPVTTVEVEAPVSGVTTQKFYIIKGTK